MPTYDRDAAERTTGEAPFPGEMGPDGARRSLREIVRRRIEQIVRERETARLEREVVIFRAEDRRREELENVAEALRHETERRTEVEAELMQVRRRTVSDQEAERQRIARELHDTLGQSLTLLRLGLDGIGQAQPENAEIQTLLAGMKNLAADADREVNRLAWEMRPAALDDLGLDAAMRSLFENWSRSASVRVDLHVALEGRRLPADVETTLYRVLQEALTNVVRHAAASRIAVIVALEDDNVTMIIEDNGRGFPAATAQLNAKPARFGLLGMRERLALVGGGLEIETTPGCGATLFIRVPV